MLYYQSIDYIKYKYPTRSVKYSITTNGSLLDENFIFFLKENSFSIRLSFDGNKATHEMNRVSVLGISYYEKIIKGIHKMKNIGLNFMIRMTIAQNTIPYMYENIRYLHEQGFNDIGMIMDVHLILSDDLKEIFKMQIDRIVDYYVQEYSKGKKLVINQFDGKMINILCDFGNCFSMCDAGITNFKIMPTGKIYPCGFLTNNTQFEIGNVNNGINIRKAKDLAASLFEKSDIKCSGCEIRDFCQGMKCGYMNYINTGKINIPTDAVCFCEQIFYKAIKKIVDYYLLQPKELRKRTLGHYIAYIKKNGLQYSKYGMKVKFRLEND